MRTLTNSKIKQKNLQHNPFINLLHNLDKYIEKRKLWDHLPITSQLHKKYAFKLKLLHSDGKVTSKFSVTLVQSFIIRRQFWNKEKFLIRKESCELPCLLNQWNYSLFNTVTNYFNNTYLPLLVTTQFKMFTSLDRQLLPVFAFCTFHTQNNLSCGLGLFRK